MSVTEQLGAFVEAHGFTKTRGALNIGLVISRKARELGLPLDPAALLAKSGGQVAGLSGEAGNRILREHGVNRSIGTEVGRTNRGSIEKMRLYVAFLNSLHEAGDLDLEGVERFWVGLVRNRFDNEPFKLRREPGLTFQFVVRDLISQAVARQRESGGATVVGTVMQHLVGAKLAAVLEGRAVVEHHGANASDQRGRGGDFDIGSAAIHVTATPGELLIAKCAENLAAGIRPIIVTTQKGAAVADGIAEQRGVRPMVEIVEIEQFLATNILELGAFGEAGAADSLLGIVERYNAIIERCESDPSLRIDPGGRRSGQR